MTNESWEKLEENDMLACVIEGKGTLPVRLACKDHNKQWIGHRLDENRKPVEVFILRTDPRIWHKLTPG